MRTTVPTTTTARSDGAFRTLRNLVAAYATVSVLSVVVIALLHDHPSLVTSTAWVRGVIVAVTSLVMVAANRSASRGSTRALLRMRILAAIMIVAIAAFVAIPGSLPLWMKIEQAACGLILVAVSVVAAGVGRRTQR